MSMKKSDVRDVTIRAFPAPQPEGEPSTDVDTVEESQGSSVSFPDGADTTSAGGAKSVDSLVQKTGSAVKFPDTADTKSAGGVTDVDSFGC